MSSESDRELKRTKPPATNSSVAPAQAASAERREQNTDPRNRETMAPERENWIDDWLAIERDGTVTVFSGKVELGTGVRTALAQIVAEELDVPIERIHMVMGDTALTPDEGYTAGSKTIQIGGVALREACAEARLALLELASETLDAALDELGVEEGTVIVHTHPDRRISYAELMGGKPFHRAITGKARPKSPHDYHIVGKPAPRFDLPSKLTGRPSFIQDLRLPGMVHARTIRPPGPGARLVSIDEETVRDISGLIKIVRLGNFLAVVAEREEEALRAAEQLHVGWENKPTLPAMGDLFKWMRAQPTTDRSVVEKGDNESGFEQAAKVLEATYYQPYQNHASIGPSCAVADFHDNQLQVWSNTQGVYPLRGAIADLLKLPLENVRVTHVEGAGSYGHNGSDDAAADAAVLSREVGRPVRVQWSREEEFAWEPKAPAMVMRVRGGLDRAGRIIAWNYQVWTPPHATRARIGADLLAGQLMTGEPQHLRAWFGGGDRNAPTDYDLPNQIVIAHWLARSPLRASAMRSLGGAGNTFANESFMDELAAAAGVDPLQFRLAHLSDPRATAVLAAAAERAGWETRPSHSERQSEVASGQGLAFVRYENREAYVATIAQIEANARTGEVRAKRFVVAHDCGLIINPDGLRNQIEGNIIQAYSRALKEEVKFDREGVTSLDWDSYPILTFSDVPEIDIVLVDRPDEPSVGAGEPATITVAAALANAIYDALGVRVRQVPFTPPRIRAALESAK